MCCSALMCAVHIPSSIAIAQLERELTSTVSKLHEEQRGRALAEQIAKDKVGGAACILMCTCIRLETVVMHQRASNVQQRQQLSSLFYFDWMCSAHLLYVQASVNLCGMLLPSGS